MKAKIFTLILTSVLIACSTKKTTQKIETSITRKQESNRSTNSTINKIIFTPPFIKKGEHIQHSYYALQYSETHEQAYWVSYKLTPNFINGTTKRTNKFKPDPLISSQSAQLKDYAHSGYDRGHLAPAGSMNKNTTAMNESFYMSNMSPQHPSFNRGIWKKLETQIRYWTYDSDSLFVVTGPILKNIEKTIGINKVAVPKYYYKVLLQFKHNQVNSLGFLLENKPSKAHLSTKAVSIDSIEKVSGIDFNYALNDSIEQLLESTVDLQNWKFHK
ncbi:DNA/RNA non-specific endonuclease [Flavicella sediminum]|uniref:DNA/RNA non-specific endonuclease n=1 Tax=Flavicella sediminum TaxID=2585141 RepID=UPI001122EC55|nr:DNA/RNA non-specific endonuclease [Flavicella sediminum]